MRNMFHFTLLHAIELTISNVYIFFDIDVFVYLN